MARIAPAGDRVTVGDSRGRRARWWKILPLILVTLPVLFNLWVLRAQTTPLQNRQDSALHREMVRWAEGQIHDGRIPLDGWYPDLQLGSALFHHYQSLPHIVTAYLALIVGSNAAYQWTLYLLLALWPLDIYLSARLFGLSPGQAGAAALVSPLLASAPGLGFEHGSYVWQGVGIWSQLWGMWMLPLAWALTWRAVAGKASYALAAFALALTIAFHFLTGYMALLATAVWVLVRPSELIRRIGRAAIVGAGGVLAAAWVIVPLLADNKWIARSIYYPHTTFDDSFGAGRVLKWLFMGELFDSRRFPVITLLVAAGVAVCVTRFRQDERGRALLAVSGVSLLLFFGRPTLGPLLDVLPLSHDLLLSRFVSGVQLGGIFLAGIGAAWLAGAVADWIPSRFPRVTPAVATVIPVALLVLALFPAWSERANFEQVGAVLTRFQVRQDKSDGALVAALIDEAKALGGGRVYAGTPTNWGSSYQVGFVAVYFFVTSQDADGIGFTGRTSSLSEDIEGLFDETNLSDYNLLNVRYILLPSDRQPSVPATLLDKKGRHTLWKVNTSGYLQVIDTIGPPVSADNASLGVGMHDFLESQSLANNLYPTVAFAGQAAPTPTVTTAGAPSRPAGSVLSERDLGNRGFYSGQVTANRQAVVLLKSSFDPRWKVQVDGFDEPVIMVAPSFVGVTVGAGTHTVVFRYQPYPDYPILFLIGGFALLALWQGPALLRRRRHGGLHGGSPSEQRRVGVSTTH